MSQSQKLPPDIESLLHSLEGEQPDDQPEEVIHVYVEEDRITFVRDTPDVIDSTPQPPRDRRSLLTAAIFLCLLLALIVASVRFQPTPTAEQFTVTVQGYALAPVHKSVTVTAQATGKGYVPATDATGEVTFYNGAIYAQIMPAGMVLEGRDGVVVVTNAQVTIPPALQTIPPTDGQGSVAAHALTPGASGNIQTGDINAACCGNSVIAQNPTAFIGGKDGQHFTYVAKSDVYNAVTPLLTRLDNQVPQLFTSVALSPQCVPTVSAVPPVGQRAAQVTITATVACKAVSYRPNGVQQAIQSSSAHFGHGKLSNIAYQVIAIDNKARITFYVTAQWTLTITRHPFIGK